jgi:helix-turn-helix protein
MEAKQLWGYDKKIDKIVYVNLEDGNITIGAVWFISNNKYIGIPYSDIANPEKASFRYEGEFKSPNLLVETLNKNGKPLKTYTYTRTK